MMQKKLAGPLFTFQVQVNFTDFCYLMAENESKNLQKYFEDDPPSFFDDLTAKGCCVLLGIAD